MARAKLTPQDLRTMKIISANLESLASRKGVSQVELSRELQIPTATLNGYFKGTSLPNPGNVQKNSWLFWSL